MFGPPPGHAGAMGILGCDLTDAALYASGFPHRVFTGIRRDAPVAWHAPDRPGPDGFWSVASWAGVTELLAVAEIHSPGPEIVAGLVDDALGSTVLEFARRPALWRTLVEAGTIDATAVDELARWVSPTAALAGVVTEELELGGKRIAPGERIVCWIASANRDDAVFGRSAMDLDLARSPNPHLAFVVDPTARDRFADRLDELVRQGPTLRLDGEAEWHTDFGRTAVRTLPVTFLA